MIIPRAPIVISLLLAGCAHSAVSVNTGVGARPAPSGSTIVSSGAGLQVQATGGAAAAIVVTGIAVGVAQQASDPRPASGYQSFSGWFWGRPTPAMDPTRTVSEQDCTQPIADSGNLRCR